MIAQTAPQPTVVSSHDSELGRWEHALRRADPRLRQYVGQYEAYSEATTFSSRLEVPHPAIVLIINFGPQLDVGPEGATEKPLRLGSFVAGLHDRPVVVTAPAGEQRGIQLNLTPLGAYQLFGMAMHEVANRAVDLDDVFGPSAKGLVEQLRHAPDWDRAFAILEAVLIERFADARLPSPGITWAWSQLVATGGAISVRELAASMECSPKHLIDQFRDQIGLPPKTVARIIRFDRVASALRDAARPDWTELALQAGYYDQAHLIREFNEFAHCTPTAYYARRLPDAGGFIADGFAALTKEAFDVLRTTPVPNPARPAR